MRFACENTSLLPKKEIRELTEKLEPESARMHEALKKGYETEYASLNLPSDKKLLKKVLETAEDKKKLKPEILVVIGIGGSNLGTLAVHEAINGRMHNETDPPVKAYFADTVDEDKLITILSIAEETLKKGGNVLVNVVTKSGTTTETIANLELFIRLLKKHKKGGHKKFVVAATGDESPLWEFARKRGYAVLEIPEKVGGRYSVFSAVGLFPLAMLGVDVKELVRGAESMVDSCAGARHSGNPAAISAATRFAHNMKGRNINDFFIFSPDLESVGKWYRQLMGESIGKEYDMKHKKIIRAGITPTVSIGSTDLHSMAQLYLGGPKDKLTTFVSVERDRGRLSLPRTREFEELSESISGKPVNKLMDAMLGGVKAAFRKSGVPYMEITLERKSEYEIGRLLEFLMIEMMFLGSLLGVNPFDQPNVESYKREARRILAGD